MRRLILLAALGGGAWWLFGRRSRTSEAGATIGFVDGSSVTLDAGSPELDRLLLIASEAKRP